MRILFLKFYKTKLFLFLFLLISIRSYSQDLPPIKLDYASVVYSEDDKVLAYFGKIIRYEILSKNDISGYVVDALLATEDRDFYNHGGVSLKGLLRAAWNTLKGKTQGGSTITMQLARNLFLTNVKTLSRKITEIEFATELEKKYSKDEILLLYLNTVYFGNNVYGLWAASQEYFGKTPDKLNLLESATLVGLLQSPNGYDPTKHPDKTLNRRNEVLHNLVEVEKLSENKFYQLKLQPLGLNLRQRIGKHFIEIIRKDASAILKQQGKSFNDGGYKIRTTLDYRIQRATENAISNQWKYFPSSMQKVQIGLISIESNTGKIKAMIGGNFDSDFMGINRATQIHRQAGSSFKPLLYASILEKGYTLATPVLDSPIVIKFGKNNIWEPQNDEATFLGKNVPLKYGLQKSLNLVAAHLINDLTVPDSLVSFARRLGIKSILPPFPSLALGTCEVTPIEMATAFSVFPSGGNISNPISLLKIEDKYGSLLYNKSNETERVLDEETSYLITDALQAVVDSGTAASIRKFYKGPAAGKTGTSQNFSDAWFVGYTPNLTTAIWIGFDDYRNKLSGNYIYGGTAAAPIWGMIMNDIQYLYDNEKNQFKKPNNVNLVELCEETGLIANPSCTKKKSYYINSLKSLKVCDKHK